MYNLCMLNMAQQGEYSTDFLLRMDQIASQPGNFKTILDELFTFVRTGFIYDNAAIYWQNALNEQPEILFARASGRGKSKEADIAWGESTAVESLRSNRMIYRKPDAPASENRLLAPHILSLPVHVSADSFGALVLIRFGGPEFLPVEITLAEYLSHRVAYLKALAQSRENKIKLDEQQKTDQLKDDFISMISHELRSPLGFIRGYTTTLLREDAHWDEKSQRDFLEIIEKETTSLQDLIENMLDSARLQSGQLHLSRQAVRLDSIFRDIQAKLSVYKPDLKMTIQADSEIQSIQGDPKRLSQVFANLIDNAIKYAPQTPISIRIQQMDHQVMVSIQDLGPGIQPEHIVHLFEKFYRIPDQALDIHGTGLGLFICKQIIDAHKGEISAASEPGKGTTFSVLLPMDSAQILRNNL